MRGRQNREHEKIEDALRQERPAPRRELADRLLARMELHARPEDVSRAPLARRRLGLTVGFATVFLMVFASFGGLGYAKSAASHATFGTKVSVTGFGGSKGSVGKGAFTPSHQDSKSDEGWGDVSDSHFSSAGHQYRGFAVVCITVKFPHGWKPIAIVVPKFVANLLIEAGKATSPPCFIHS